MVNPAYPPQMQMPQPGMPGPGRPGPAMPMGMGPGIPQANMVRRGTPKAVPIVVSAGLAVGVFCGLYFGLGTGEKTAAAEVSATKTGENAPPSAAPATDQTTDFKSAPVDPSTGKPSTDPTATAGSAAAPTPGTDPAAAGTPGTPGTDPSGTPPPGTPSAPAEVSVELTFEVTPEDATITIDDEPVTGGKATIKFVGDEKTIRVVGKASGFKSYDKKVTIAKDATAQTIEVKLAKKSSGGPRPPKIDREPPGGLIDL